MGTGLLVLNLGLFALNESDTSPVGPQLPADVTEITPAPDQLSGLVDTVSATLRSGYTGVLVVDGVEIPEDQLERIPGLNQISFRPGPGREISRFRAGDNTVVVKYWEGLLKDRPANPFSYSWTFKAAA